MDSPKLYDNAYKIISNINTKLGIQEVDDEKLKSAMIETYQFMSFS